MKISNPNISLLNNIGTPPNYPSKRTLEIVDAESNIYLARQDTTQMAPFIMSNDTTERLRDGRTMESSHIATLHLPDLIKKAS